MLQMGFSKVGLLLHLYFVAVFFILLCHGPPPAVSPGLCWQKCPKLTLDWSVTYCSLDWPGFLLGLIWGLGYPIKFVQEGSSWGLGNGGEAGLVWEKSLRSGELSKELTVIFMNIEEGKWSSCSSNCFYLIWSTHNQHTLTGNCGKGSCLQRVYNPYWQLSKAV